MMTKIETNTETMNAPVEDAENTTMMQEEISDDDLLQVTGGESSASPLFSVGQKVEVVQQGKVVVGVVKSFHGFNPSNQRVYGVSSDGGMILSVREEQMKSIG